MTILITVMQKKVIHTMVTYVVLTLNHVDFDNKYDNDIFKGRCAFIFFMKIMSQ